MHDNHIDPFDYIDKSGQYNDYYDTVQKTSDGKVFVKRSHSIYLPGTTPYSLTGIGDEIIPLDALTPEALAQVQHIAAKLEGGDKPLFGKTYYVFYWVAKDDEGFNQEPDLKNRQVTVKADYDFPDREVKQFDTVYKRPNGEVFVQRDMEIFLKDAIHPLQSLPSTEIPLENLSPQSLKRVMEIAETLDGHDFPYGKSNKSFRWNEDRLPRWVNPLNRQVILKS